MVRRNPLHIAAAVALVLVTGACGGDEEAASPEAQPTPNATTFQPGRFDDLPLFPRSEPLGPRSEEAGVVSRSFMATGATPQQLIEYYRGSLGDGWILLREPEKLGTGTFRADWANGDWRLRVSATREPSLELDNASREVTVQYSLTLSPLTER